MILSKSKGIVSIYSGEDKLIMALVYTSKQQMKNTIAVWNRNFPDGYYIQVKPAILMPRGYKKPVYHSPVVIEDVKNKLIRPAAVYSNSTPYKYT